MGQLPALWNILLLDWHSKNSVFIFSVGGENLYSECAADIIILAHSTISVALLGLGRKATIEKTRHLFIETVHLLLQ